MILVTILLVTACGGCGAARAASPGAVAPTAAVAPSPGTAAEAVPPEKLVIEGTLRVEVREVGDLVPALRRHVDGLGGRVLTEEVSGAETSWRASLRVRVPPDRVDAVVDWLAHHGEITDKRISATDVSKTLFDQALALENLRATSTRLQALLAQGGLKMEEILAIERELTRVRGEIESLEGNQRFLEDRVALATLDIELTRQAGAVLAAHAKVHLGPRFATLVLLDPAGRARTRLGGGFAIHMPEARVSWEIDVFGSGGPAMAGSDGSDAVVATWGGAFYSDLLGRGERPFLNPYVGFRLGYGYLGGSSFVVQGDAGVELVKTRYVVVDAGARMTAFIDGDGADPALLGGASAVVPF